MTIIRNIKKMNFENNIAQNESKVFFKKTYGIKIF